MAWAHGVLWFTRRRRGWRKNDKNKKPCAGVHGFFCLQQNTRHHRNHYQTYTCTHVSLSTQMPPSFGQVLVNSPCSGWPFDHAYGITLLSPGTKRNFPWLRTGKSRSWDGIDDGSITKILGLSIRNTKRGLSIGAVRYGQIFNGRGWNPRPSECWVFAQTETSGRNTLTVWDGFGVLRFSSIQGQEHPTL